MTEEQLRHRFEFFAKAIKITSGSIFCCIYLVKEARNLRKLVL